MTERTHSILKNGQRHTWCVSRLWALSNDLPRFEYDVSRFQGFDQDWWFCSVHVPTIRRVLEHMQRIEASDLTYPILLSETGVVMDGVHRICKAYLEGRETITAVQFSENPPPDTIEDWPQ
jgi:hypothetical protein